ncbi:MAG TPA: hypothetical protein VHG88_03160 [Burkholderiales bacterium]|nr:hypothetical protein [Burkholderiales bacterium]
MFTAIARVTGAGRLEDFRERLRWLMVRDHDAEDYTEHHGEGLLEYRFTPKRGIPFPTLTEVSSEFPELQVDVEWEHDGARGRALIEAGKLVQAPPEAPGGARVEVAVEEDGRLALALACRQAGNELIGYAATADRHTYFRFRDGALSLVDPESPDAALEEVAFAFVDEWIWYDEEQAPVERSRYAGYGYPVRGANLKSDKLAVLRTSGMQLSSLDAEGRRARDALVAQWLNRS